MRERVLAVDGRTLRYLVGGEGEPLVLCHGFMGSAENFETWFDELCTRRTLVVPDLPGCGASTALSGAHTADSLAGSLEPLLDELGLDHFDLGGLCLGASVACALTRRRPDAVGRLILHTPLLAPDLVRRRFHRQVGLMTAPGVYPAVVWLSRRRLVSDVYKRTMVEGPDVDPRAADVNFLNQRRASPRGTREWLRDGLRRRDIDLVSARRDPVLILAAADDRIVDVRRLAELVAHCDQIDMAVIDEAGHGWSQDFVRRQLAVLGSFLEGHRQPAAVA